MRPEVVILVVALLTSFAAGASFGVLLCIWMTRSARRVEREILQEYGSEPDRQSEPGS